MVLKLYNTLTRKKEVFNPIHKNQVGIYSCGPTVYQFAHIGNLRKYIFDDTLTRTLRFSGLNVKHVMNITDVGHLTSDADLGEDKIKTQAKKEKKSAYDIAKFYEKAFFEDFNKLNILKPSIVCKATDHIKEMIDLIKKLEKNGYTYTSGGNVYFRISKFKNYGELANLDLEELKAGARIEVDKKKEHPLDFVLWFTESKFKDQEMVWDSPWGVGYPGWHIECSAMSMKYLGEQFDIHTGGVDHIPVHHTNEIAQSEAATGKKPWVKVWMHCEFLVLKEGKMSKSKGGFLTLSNLIENGYDPIDFRYLCLGTHYKKPLMFSFESLDAAKNAVNKLKERVLELKKSKDKVDSKTVEKYKEQFLKEISDDINTPKALAILWEVIQDNQLSSKTRLELIKLFDEVLGLKLDKVKGESIPNIIIDLAKKRAKARKDKKWGDADKLRGDIKKKGYLIEDSEEGFVIKKI